MVTTLPAHKIAELKTESHALKPIVQIGKSGLTESALAEIAMHMKKRKLVKIKFLKSLLETTDKRELVETITSKTKSELISLVGFVAVLYKR